MAHWSSCAVHNEPALPKGECDCGNDAPEQAFTAYDPFPPLKDYAGNHIPTGLEQLQGEK